MLEKGGVDKCWKEVLQKRSVGEECCRAVLAKGVVREVLEKSGVEKCWRRVL